MISREEVIKIANLAMLELTSEEVDNYTLQLDSLLEHFKAIQELDLSSISPTNNAGANFNVLRDDSARPSLERGTVVGQSHGNDGRNFIVPAIINAEEQ